MRKGNKVRQREREEKREGDEGRGKETGGIYTHLSHFILYQTHPPLNLSPIPLAFFSLHYRCPPPPTPLAHIWQLSCLFPASPHSPYIISICPPSLHSSLCSQTLIASVCFLYHQPASITCNALGSCPNTAIQPDVPSDSMPPPLPL